MRIVRSVRDAGISQPEARRSSSSASGSPCSTARTGPARRTCSRRSTRGWRDDRAGPRASARRSPSSSPWPGSRSASKATASAAVPLVDARDGSAGTCSMAARSARTRRAAAGAVGLHARSADPGQGTAGRSAIPPRRLRGRAAARASRGAPALRASPGAAQRPAAPDPRRGRRRRIRSTPGTRELAAAGIELIEVRSEAIAVLTPLFAEAAAELGLDRGAELTYRPRSTATDSAESWQRSYASGANRTSVAGSAATVRISTSVVLRHAVALAAPVRLAGPTAHGAAGAAVRRARRPARRAHGAAAGPARRCDQRARPEPARAALRAPAAGDGPGADHGDRIRAPARLMPAQRGRGRGGRPRLGPGAVLMCRVAGTSPAHSPTRCARCREPRLRRRRWPRCRPPGAGGRQRRSRPRPMPVSEREGVVTIACRSATWAQELDLMQNELLESLLRELANGRLGGRDHGPPIHRRCGPSRRFAAES